jgi:hypothetical protein
MEKMVTSNATRWTQPLGILGYDDTWRVFGGPFFEASTSCTAEHNTGNVGWQSPPANNNKKKGKGKKKEEEASAVVAVWVLARVSKCLICFGIFFRFFFHSFIHPKRHLDSPTWRFTRARRR